MRDRAVAEDVLLRVEDGRLDEARAEVERGFSDFGHSIPLVYAAVRVSREAPEDERDSALNDLRNLSMLVSGQAFVAVVTARSRVAELDGAVRDACARRRGVGAGTGACRRGRSRDIRVPVARACGQEVARC